MAALGKTYLMEKGNELVAKASQAMKAQKHSVALKFYEQATEYFIEAMQLTTNTPADVSELIKVCDDVLNRSKGLREFLMPGEEPPKNVDAEVVSKHHRRPNLENLPSTSSNASVVAQLHPQLVAQINGSILKGGTGVAMDDVIGLEDIKKEILESIFLAKKFPKTMADRGVNNSLLLFGPPGTGKTHVAKAFATAAGSTFFSVKGSDLSSEWHGEAEMLIRLLFENARGCKDSIVFLDECEMFCPKRSKSDRSHDSKVKGEILVQLGDLSNMKNVFVIAATNVPHLLDVAFRRRFANQVYVPLPDSDARQKLFRYEVSRWKHTLKDDDFVNLAERTEGFSNSDIASIAKIARNAPPKEAYYATHFKAAGGDLMSPCLPDDKDGSAGKCDDYGEARILMGPITHKHFTDALKGKKPSVARQDLNELEKYNEEYLSQK